MNATDFADTEALLRHSGYTITAARYHSQAFGSWYIQVAATPPLRVVWDGKDRWLILEEETTEVFNGSTVWRDLWIGKTRSDQTPRRALARIIHE